MNLTSNFGVLITPADVIAGKAKEGWFYATLASRAFITAKCNGEQKIDLTAGLTGLPEFDKSYSTTHACGEVWTSEELKQALEELKKMFDTQGPMYNILQTFLQGLG